MNTSMELELVELGEVSEATNSSTVPLGSDGGTTGNQIYFGS